MYPNPQDVLPLPPRPSLEHYRKRAKDLVKACKSSEPDAIRRWSTEWLTALASRHDGTEWQPSRSAIDAYAHELSRFAREKLAAQCALANAQFIIARAHGFLSWPKFAKHLDALALASSAESAFERAADAIIAGDSTTLRQLLRENDGLVRARSTREHRATLLHYVAANGVENYRQRTPPNAVEIARLLLDAGAAVDAEADMYGGGATTLGLVATSVHPDRAGVQIELMDLLLERGARIDDDAVNACLANGRPTAASYLARLGAPLDLEAAAGVGRVERVRQLLLGDGSAPASVPERQRAFSMACAYGQLEVVRVLLDGWVAPGDRLMSPGEGHTGLHVAAYGGHADIVELLLDRGAPVDVVDAKWGTTPLVWALYAWRNDPIESPEQYQEVVSRLVAAGAVVPRELLDNDRVRADPKMLAALSR